MARLVLGLPRWKNEMVFCLQQTDEHTNVLASPFVWSVILSVGLVGIALMSVRPSFLSNDDVAMMLIVQGLLMTSQPDPHVVFSNIVWGKILSGLYTYWPDWPWYASYHLVVILISTAATTYSVLKASFSYYRIFLCCVCIVALIIPSVFSMHFTATSFLAGQAGVFLFISIMLSGNHRSQIPVRSFHWSGALAVLLCVISYLVREKSFLFVAILTAPAYLMIVIRTYRINDVCVKPFGGRLPYGFPLILLLCLVLFHTHHYKHYDKSCGWKGFLEFNRTRTEFNDYHRAKYDEPTKQCFERVNWSRNDYEMLMRWGFADGEVFSHDKLTKIMSCCKLKFNKSVDLKSTFEAIGRNFERLWPRAWFIIILLWYLIGFDLISKSFFAISVALSTLSCWFLTLIVLSSYFKLPIWVFGPSSAFICWLVLLVYPERVTPGARLPRAVQIARCVVGLVLFVLTVLSVCEYSKLSKQVTASNEALRSCLSALQPQPDQLFVSWGGNFPFEAILPFEDQSYLKKIRLASLGALNQSPVQTRMLQRFGVFDLMSALFEKDNIFIIGKTRIHRDYDLYRTYVQEHYGRNVELKVQFECGSLFVHKVEM